MPVGSRRGFAVCRAIARKGKAEPGRDTQQRACHRPVPENQQLGLRHHRLDEDVHRALAGTAIARQRHHALAALLSPVFIGHELFRPQADKRRLAGPDRLFRGTLHRRGDAAAAKPAFGEFTIVQNKRLHPRLRRCRGQRAHDRGHRMRRPGSPQAGRDSLDIA